MTVPIIYNKKNGFYFRFGAKVLYAGAVLLFKLFLSGVKICLYFFHIHGNKMRFSSLLNVKLFRKILDFSVRSIFNIVFIRIKENRESMAKKVLFPNQIEFPRTSVDFVKSPAFRDD